MPADARVACVHVCLVIECSASLRDFSAISQKSDAEEAIYCLFSGRLGVSGDFAASPTRFSSRLIAELLVYYYFFFSLL